MLQKMKVSVLQTSKTRGKIVLAQLFGSLVAEPDF